MSEKWKRGEGKKKTDKRNGADKISLTSFKRCGMFCLEVKVMTTLREAVESLRAIVIPKKIKNIATELLGKYTGLVPKGKTSTAWIKGLRSNLYGKVK